MEIKERFGCNERSSLTEVYFRTRCDCYRFEDLPGIVDEFEEEELPEDDSVRDPFMGIGRFRPNIQDDASLREREIDQGNDWSDHDVPFENAEELTGFIARRKATTLPEHIRDPISI